MLNINTIFLFVFIFSILVSLRNLVRLIGALLGNELKLSNRDLLFFGLSISYILTYILQV
jgi:hypothetical protein